EALFGFLPSIVTPALSARVTPQKIRLLVASAAAIGAEEALRIGLVDDVVPADALDAAGARAVRDFSRTDPAAVARLRRFLDETATLPMPEALARGAELSRELLSRVDVRARIDAFLDGDAPWRRT